MITLIEKRLQDLEARIPTFLAKIEEQQKKMAEIYSFPNDLAQARLEHKSLYDFVEDFVELQRCSEISQDTITNNTWKAIIELKTIIDNEV